MSLENKVIKGYQAELSEGRLERVASTDAG
jgi:hypothetical protein